MAPRATPARWPAAMLVRTAAEYLDCSPSQVEKLIREGELGCIQFNERGDRRILKEDIDAYLYRRSQMRVVA
jgi:excisionase family DNA binding protein